MVRSAMYAKLIWLTSVEVLSKGEEVAASMLQNVVHRLDLSSGRDETDCLGHKKCQLDGKSSPDTAFEVGMGSRDVLKYLAQLKPQKYSPKVGAGIRFEGPKATCGLCTGSDSMGAMLTSFAGSSKFIAGFSTDPAFSSVLGDLKLSELVIQTDNSEQLEETLTALLHGAVEEVQANESSYVLPPVNSFDPELQALKHAEVVALDEFNAGIVPKIFDQTDVAVGESFTHGMLTQQVPAGPLKLGWGWYAPSHKAVLIETLTEACHLGAVQDRVSDENITEPQTIYLASRALMEASSAASGVGTTGWAGAGFPDTIPDWFSVGASVEFGGSVIGKVLRVEVGVSMFQHYSTEVRRAITRRLGVAAAALAHSQVLGSTSSVEMLRQKLEEFKCRVVEIDVRHCEPVRVQTWGNALTAAAPAPVKDCDCMQSACACPWPRALMSEEEYGNPWSQSLI